MASLEPQLLRSVLVHTGDLEADVLANLTALRADIQFEGLDAHLLQFVGSIADRSGKPPTAKMVFDHYQSLSTAGHPYGHAGMVKLTDLAAASLPFQAPADYRYTLDQFRDRVIGDGLGVLLQQAATALVTGHTVRPPKAPPVTYRGPTDAVHFLETGLSELLGQFRTGDIHGTLRDLHAVSTRYQQRVGQTRRGVLSGFQVIDQHHDGLMPGDLALVLGYTSQMKSTVCMNIGYHAAIKQGRNVGIVPLEGSVQDLQDLIVGLHCLHPKFGAPPTITADRMRRAELTADEEKVVATAIDDLATSKSYGQLIYYEPDKPDITVGDVRRWAEQEDKKVPLDLLIVDYAALTNPSSGGNSMKESAYANIAVREWKQTAKAFRRGHGIAVLSPWQSNRKGYEAAVKNGGRYELTAMAWAPESEKSSDFVYYVFRDKTLADSNQLQMGNLKARGRKLIMNDFLVYADAALRTVEDMDMTRPHQQIVPALGGLL